MKENETELVQSLLLDMVRQLEKDPAKLPIVYMFPQEVSSSPTQEDKPVLGSMQKGEESVSVVLHLHL